MRKPLSILGLLISSSLLAMNVGGINVGGINVGGVEVSPGMHVGGLSVGGINVGGVDLDERSGGGGGGPSFDPPPPRPSKEDHEKNEKALREAVIKIAEDMAKILDRSKARFEAAATDEERAELRTALAKELALQFESLQRRNQKHPRRNAWASFYPHHGWLSWSSLGLAAAWAAKSYAEANPLGWKVDWTDYTGAGAIAFIGLVLVAGIENMIFYSVAPGLAQRSNLKAAYAMLLEELEKRGYKMPPKVRKLDAAKLHGYLTQKRCDAILGLTPTNI
jgi:hypothetical protein